MICAPQLRGNEELASVDSSCRETFFDAFAYLFLVAVDIGTVDMAVTDFDGVGDCLLDLTFRGLPRPCRSLVIRTSG